MEHQKQCRKCGGIKFHRRGREYPTKECPEGKWRYSCVVCGYKTTNPYPTKPEIDQFYITNKYGTWDKDSSVHLITAAQNATPAHPKFLAALKRYAEHRNASLSVIPFRYKNPTSLWSEKDTEDNWWDEAVTQYLYSKREKINDNLRVIGDIPIQPTMTNPLSGLDSITGSSSGIVGHPKLSLKAIPTPHHKLPKLMTTTGAVTADNYTNTKAGKKGQFHHTFGAAVVELDPDGKMFHLRQINASPDGSFVDLDTLYTANEVKPDVRAEALVMGDIHVDYLDPNVVAATITDKDSMVNVLKPKYIVLHDVLDMYARSHHTRNDPFINVAKRKAEKDDLLEEVVRACAWIDIIPEDIQVVFVPSNHHDHLYRWMKETDWRYDLINSEMYLETALHMVQGAVIGEHGAKVPDPFIYWAKRLIKTKDRCIFLDRRNSFTIKDIEVGLHGDMGPNGSRASGPSMAKMGVKTVLGHTHTPMIHEGAYWAGTSTRLQLEYNLGPSSWLNSHVVIYPSGKRSIINIIDGKWRL